jgi:Calcineurin-like phosphoesterase
MKSPIITIYIGILLIFGCTRSDDIVALQYRAYTEGPHVLLDKKAANVLSFSKAEKTWIMQQKHISAIDGAKLQVDNPVMDPFTVRLRNETDPIISEYPAASTMTVVADIEGNFAGFYSLLVAQGVIDVAGNWIYGDGHLLMLGDLVDRGPDVTPILWLLYKLEPEARNAGGVVHTLLGNHEIMNFNGDLRYLNKKYKSQSEDTGIEYPQLYSTKTILGLWLRNKPAVIRIGNILFSHAGISPEVLALNINLQELNSLVKQQNLNVPIVHRIEQSVTVFGTNGIFWYRGWVDKPQAGELLKGILTAYQVDHMIIGHTVVRQIKASFNYKLIAIDLHQPKNINKRSVRALLIEGNKFYEIDNRGGRKTIKSN